MSNKPVEIEKLLTDPSYDVTAKTRESPEERASRLKREEEDAALARKKDFITFLFTPGVVSVIVVASLYALFRAYPKL